MKRQEIAFEVMLTLLDHNKVAEKSIWTRIKIFFGIEGWNVTHNYNFKNIVDRSYEVADEFLKERKQ